MIVCSSFVIQPPTATEGGTEEESLRPAAAAAAAAATAVAALPGTPLTHPSVRPSIHHPPPFDQQPEKLLNSTTSGGNRGGKGDRDTLDIGTFDDGRILTGGIDCIEEVGSLHSLCVSWAH